MPKFPDLDPRSLKLPERPFSKFAAEIQAMGKAKYPLHIGDTYLEPLQGARLQDVHLSEYPTSHQYTSPKGLPSLLQDISTVYQVPVEQIQVTPGATGGLHLVAMASLSPGDEVLILAPYWPLAAGIVRAVGAIPISVPFYDQSQSIAERIEPYVSDRTVAVYVNSPNNPTGIVLHPDDVRELGRLAVEKDLWIFADEVYERVLFEGSHLPIREVAPDRTISIFSFSKAYAMAGYRCGFLLLPDEPLARSIGSLTVHSFYSVSTPAQIAAGFVLRQGDEWLQGVREIYADTGRRAANVLGLPAPQGGTFLFFDISDRLGGRTMDQFLRACIAEKLLLAPGAAFGEGYENYIRLCFTCVEPERVLEGMNVLCSLLD